MKLKDRVKKNKGSATLVVIITSIIFMIYAQSTYADIIHMKNMYDSYEKDILDEYQTKYEKKINNINLYEEAR